MIKTGRTAILADLGTLALAAAILYLTGLGTRDLWNPNEPVYGRAVVEMAERGDWLIPTVNGKEFAEKPILYFWMALASSGAAGEITEFTLRVPSVIATSAALFLTYFIVLPYAGRRRALMTAILLASTYSVFWCARWVQMDSLVLACTAATLLPLTRMADHGFSNRWGWLWVGLAAGVGFLAKGPVAVLLPALVFTGYAAATRRLRLLVTPWVLLAALPFASLVLPWLASIHLAGHDDFLREMLIRQNFSRFVSAWDHQHPWYYYLKYIWIDFAPWSWFAPLALFTVRTNHGEGRLRTLACCWIAGIIIFFSLSDSKRSPYILPIAPAVAMMAAIYFQNLFNGTLSGRLRAAGKTLFGFWALMLAGGAVFLLNSSAPQLAGQPVLAWFLSALLLAGATCIAAGILVHRTYRSMAASALFSFTLVLYVFSAVWLLPIGNHWKSARSFCTELEATLAPGDQIRSYRLWDWRAEYAFYLGREVRNLHDPEQLRRYWGEEGQRMLIVEESGVRPAQYVLGAAPTMMGRIGGRRVFLFEKPVPPDRPLATPALAAIRTHGPGKQ